MSYIVTLTNGTVLTTIADATIDDSSSLTLIGRNYPGYGQYIAVDMIHMLEHFSNGTAPPSPLAGQLWYNSTTGLLNIYNGTSWSSVSLAPTAPVGGDLTGNLPNPLIKSSVNLTGTPTAVTAIPGTNTTQLATTAFVTAVANQSVSGDLTGSLPAPTIKSSVNLTGVPTAPTPIVGATTNQIATAAFVASSTLLLLTAPLNLYVATTGSDSNAGTNSAPFLTLQRAWNYIVSSINANGQQITINVANGTYNAGVLAVGVPTGVTNPLGVAFIGNIGTPSNVVINLTNSNGCFTVANGSSLVVQGFKIQSSGSATDFIDAGYGLVASVGGSIYFNNLVFGVCGTAHMIADAGGYIGFTQAGATYVISGNSPYHMIATCCGVYGTVDGTCQLVGPPAFSSAFAYSTSCGIISIYSMSFPGSGAIGTKYIATVNGVINTNGAGISYLPGTIAGSSGTGGLYF